ncbi:MAG: DUF547 domain-containing protein [Motiliproteus sp.]
MSSANKGTSNSWLCLAFLCLIFYKPSVQSAEMDWSLYNELLQQYVSAGQVEGVTLNLVGYSKLSKDPRFSQLLEQLQRFPLDNLNTKEEKLSFYINAYNILAIQMVIKHWPLASIKDVGSWWQPVWKKEAGSLGGSTVSLDQIEHEVLRKLQEPRIHFAIACASLSCPDLRKEAYTADLLVEQLNSQARIFLKNKSKGLSRNSDEIVVSKIFDWFAEDFSAEGGVQAFINQYSEVKTSEIKGYLPYNWQVNGT